MKKCNYCGKEISYHEMYCSDDCQINANKFYDMREKFTGIFSVINGIFVMAIGVGIFAYAFVPALGAWMVTISLLTLSVLYFFLPFPPDVIIEKKKLKSAISFCRIISAILLVLGITALILTILFVK